jgi:ubiquitin-activating enzyme E1
VFEHGHKRYPQVAEWDASKDEYVKFFYHAVNIMVNQIFDLKTPVDEATIKEKLAALEVPEWVLSEETIDIDEDEDEKEEEKVEIGDDEEKELQALKEKLKAIDISKVTKLKAADFEKDDAKNHHIDIITSATNLRAWNYTLEETTNQHVRMIAGKIIPAIATTTACITGFIGLEVMKHAREADLDSFRMATINLAVNSFVLENLPDPIKKKSGLDPETQMEFKAVPEGFTTWDFIEIKKPDVTLQEFIDEIKKCHHDCTLTLLGDEEKVYYDDAKTKYS